MAKNLEEIQRALYRFEGEMTYEDQWLPAARTAKRTNSKKVDEISYERRASLVGGLDPGGDG